MGTATTAITIESQAKTLQESLTTSLANFFEQIPELAMYVAQSEALVAQAAALNVFSRDDSGAVVVFDQAAYEEAAGHIQAIAAVVECFEELIQPYIAQAYSLHKNLCAIKVSYTNAGEIQRERLKREMAQWKMEYDRRAEAEAQRIAKQQRDAEEARLLAEAANAAADGRKEESEEILAEAVNVRTPTTLPRQAPAVSGLSYRSQWIFDDKNIDMATLKVEYQIPAQPNLKAIAALVRSMKKGAEQLLGGKMVDGVFVPAVKVSENKIPVER